MWLGRSEEEHRSESWGRWGGEKIMSGPGSHCKDFNKMRAKESFEQRTDTAAGVLWLLIQEHPERDKGGCIEISKASATIIKGNDSGSGGRG